MSQPKWAARALALVVALALTLSFSGSAFAQRGGNDELATGHSEGYLQLSSRVDKNVQVAAGDTLTFKVIAKNVQRGTISGVIVIMPIQTQFYSVVGTRSSDPNTQFVFIKDLGVEGIDFGSIAGNGSVTAEIQVRLNADAVGGFELRNVAFGVFDNPVGGGFVQSNRISTNIASASTADGSEDAIQPLEVIPGFTNGVQTSVLLIGRSFVPGEKVQTWVNADPATGLGVIGPEDPTNEYLEASEADEEEGDAGGLLAVRVSLAAFPKGTHSLVLYSTRSDTTFVGQFTVK